MAIFPLLRVDECDESAGLVNGPVYHAGAHVQITTPVTDSLLAMR